ncbi:helix-turn-helix transcriptional regulator [Marinomonas posidonica]|uniref:helix-turn-helix transcriptional regulator n=1 Tax=Marinomonas posidonica TaxID=936476 RepID=UPI0037361424
MENSNTQMQTKAESALAEKLEQLIQTLSKPKVADNKTLWGSNECAAYLGLSKKKFMGDVACKRTFPKARNVGGSENRTNWRWVASDVMAWALAQKITH